MKVAVITDSNSGITQYLGEELGISIVPMPFSIDDETYFEDITLTRDEFYNKLTSDATIFTSQPSLGDILDLWKSTLETFDEIVYIPMSSGLSGSYESAAMLAHEFQGKVQVVNNLRISVTLKQAVLDALFLVKAGKTSIEIKEILEESSYQARIYIMVDTLYYLKKGGRITAAAAALGTMLKIKPVLQVQGTKLDAFAKARTSNQGKTLMINAIKHDLATCFENVDPSLIKLSVVHSHNEEIALEWKAEIEALFPEYEVELDHLSLSVACHVGPGALAIAATRICD
ncbi:MAG: DegV family protein [Eubacteriales bacterium]